jgi:hypothetical protein
VQGCAERVPDPAVGAGVASVTAWLAETDDVEGRTAPSDVATQTRPRLPAPVTTHPVMRPTPPLVRTAVVRTVVRTTGQVDPEVTRRRNGRSAPT